MSVLAIDPGNTQSGYVVLDDAHVRSAGVVSNKVMAEVTYEYFRQCSLAQQLPRVAIEMIACYGMPVGQEVFDTCRFIGRMEMYCEFQVRVSPQLVYRKDVKLHLCGSPRAKDQNVRQALIDRFGKQGTKKDKGPTYGITSHAWAALAVAAFALDHPQEPRT